MTNWLFTAQQISVLLRPAQWRVIRSGYPEVSDNVPTRMRRWYTTHRQRHAQREVLVCLAGAGFYGLGNCLYRTAPGVVMVFDSMELHQLGYPRFLPDQEHLWIAILPDQFTARVLRIRRGRTEVQSAAALLFDADDVGFRVTDRTLGMGGAHPLTPEIRGARLFAAVAAMTSALVQHGYQPPPPARTRLANPQRVMASIMEHLQATGGRGDSLGSLARIAGYSPFHFLRLFKRITGHTVHGYIDQCRRQKVRQLMDANWTQAAIAGELGFSSPQSFCRWRRRNQDRRP